VSVNTVAASMARQSLRGRSAKHKRCSLIRPDKAAAPIPDLVKRDFSAERIDQRWCGDLTEIPTDECKLYLATVLDLASRRLPGFALSDHHDSAVAEAALCRAAAARGGDVPGVVFHSDKGGEYVGDLFAQACQGHGVTQSMGRVAPALEQCAGRVDDRAVQDRVHQPRGPVARRRWRRAGHAELGVVVQQSSEMSCEAFRHSET
jgi:transposase InsO family protein